MFTKEMLKGNVYAVLWILLVGYMGFRLLWLLFHK